MLLFFIILVKNVLYQLPHPPLIVRMTPPLTVMNVVVNIPHLVVGKDRNQLTVIDPYRPLNTILTIHILLQEESPEVNCLLQGSLIVNVGQLPLFCHQMIIILIVNVVRLPLAMIIMVIVSFSMCHTILLMPLLTDFIF